MLLSSYYHLVWLALIGISSELSSFYTLSKLIMKLIPPVAPKTPAEIKRIAALLMNPGPQVPGDDSLMDWSADIPEVQSSPTPYGPPAGGNVLSPRAHYIIGMQKEREG